MKGDKAFKWSDEENKLINKAYKLLIVNMNIF